MQKKIIALAVAGLVSGVAFAQSNVTIFFCILNLLLGLRSAKPTWFYQTGPLTDEKLNES